MAQRKLTAPVDDADSSTGKVKCWAHAVSPCEGIITGEHFLSYGLFRSETIMVKGGPFTKPRTLPVKSLVTNCLCKRHNEELSPLDLAAVDVVNALRELEELRAVRAGLPWKFPGPAPFRYRVGGLLFERWLAKVVLGCVAFFSGKLDSWNLPPWLAKVPFGLEHLPDGAGLAGLARVGDKITGAEDFQLMAGQRPRDTKPTAVLFSARGGFRFFFSWEV